MIEGTSTKLAERSRTYTFPNGNMVTLYNITELIVRPSGSHRIKTFDKKLHIIPMGWIHLEIDSDDWVV